MIAPTLWREEICAVQQDYEKKQVLRPFVGRSRYHIPMMPAYAPKPAVDRTIKPTTQAYPPLSRQGSGSALRANRYKKPRSMGSSRAFITFTLMASFTELTPESTMPA